MQEPPWGYRRPEDEHLFVRPTNDRSIVPDCVSPAVEGYFRIPAVWIGKAPDPDTVRVLNPPVHHAVVHQKKLRCGIEARVRRDGTFLFDFSSWPLAPTIVIPGYKIRDRNKPYRRPRENTRAEQKAEAFAVRRAQVMNVHQACLTTSEMAITHSTATMGYAVTAWNTLKAMTFDAPPPYYDDTGDIHSLAQNVLNNKDRVARHQPLPRRVIGVDVVDHSLGLLDDILIQCDLGFIQIVEAAYIAACRQREKRFGEAVTLAWGACEQMISLLWVKLLEDVTTTTGVVRMPNSRRQKLVGRDYTASVMLEMLEINERIDHEMYRLLDLVRKARNKWAHEMRMPKENESNFSIHAVQRIIQQVKGVRLWLQSGGRGGVPQWAVWLWEEEKARRRAQGPDGKSR
jgi:hypothetical protein